MIVPISKSDGVCVCVCVEWGEASIARGYVEPEAAWLNGYNSSTVTARST